MHEGNNCRGCLRGDVVKILFITLSNIGDVILTLPVLSALKDNFPDAVIDIVVGPRPKDIFIKDPRVNEIFTYDKHASFKERLDFIKTLRAKQYDLAADMRTSLIPVLINAKNRTGLVSWNRPASRHKRSAHLDKLKELGIKYKAQRNIYVDNKDRDMVQGLLEKAGCRKGDILIGVSPACRGHLKQWRTDGFIEVINNLLRQGNCKIVLIGDAAGIDVAKKIKAAVRQDGIIDLTGRTNLNELFGLIGEVQVLLTGDSACLHIACDLGIKVAAIFGPTDPEEYGPTGEKDIVIQKDLKCAPCKKALCSSKHECMQEITSGEVLAAVKKILTYEAS